MTYEQVIDRLTKTEFFSASAGLYRMRSMLRYFDDPQESVPCVHVAGTNGKGSVCAILDSILRQAGYRVGLFTSPYLYDFRERIRVNGKMIEPEAVAELGTQVYDYLEKSYSPANQFELITVLAMLYFRREHCDIVILETGLGGTFDPTNVITKPVASVITNIGLDHCAVLGDTIEKIAAAKAGIIKPGCDVCVYPVSRDAEYVISSAALSAGSPIHIVDAAEVHREPPVKGYEHFSYRGLDILLSLRGKHQQYNAATALEAIRVINEHGFYVSDMDIENGCKTVSWPGRLEMICKKPVVYFDGGHNPQCARAVADWFRSEEFAGKRLTVLAGIVGDKDADAMLNVYRSITDRLYFYRFANRRAMSEERAEELCAKYSMIPVADLNESLRAILDKAGRNDILLITGSLYLASEAVAAVNAYTAAVKAARVKEQEETED